MDTSFELEITEEERNALEFSAEILEELIKNPYSQTKINLSENFSLTEYESTDILSFMTSLFMFHSMDLEMLVISIIYIKRLFEKANIGPKNIKMVLCISCLTAKKYLEDFTKKLSLAKMLDLVGEVTQRSEIEFLKIIDYRILVTESAFNVYKNMLMI